MTSEEQDALVGRVIREYRVADEVLRQLLVKAETITTDLDALRVALCRRIDRARAAGKEVYGSANLAGDAGFERGALEVYRESLDLDALRALDTEIGQAVAVVLRLQQQKRDLRLP